MILVKRLDALTAEELKKIQNRAQTNIDAVRQKVEEIIEDVRANGDDALVRYSKQWDDPNYTIQRLQVTAADVEKAYASVDKEVINRIKEQIQLSRSFHEFQRSRITHWEYNLENGIVVGEKWTPIPAVGLYVPGGKNPFPTVQQILAVPARIAGAKRIVSCISPRGENHEVIVAARECGVEEIYRVNGAQAVAAMAYGTQTIKPVDLIAGPGSPYVTAAKIMCQSKVAIDMPAGPSEAIVLADASTPRELTLETKAKYCAADLLARAEHGPDSAAVLLTDSPELAKLVAQEIERQYQSCSRKEYIKEALQNYSAILIVSDMSDAIDFTNEYAPEHLEILTSDPDDTFKEIENAGSVFLGYYNPVATGDYATGINHILPSSGWAKQCSPVSVWTFMKRVQFSTLTKAGLKRLQPIVQAISAVEGLDAHCRSVDIRFSDERRDAKPVAVK